MSHQPTRYCTSCYNPVPPDQEGRNPHKRDCPKQSPEQMLAVIKMQMGEAAWDKNQWVKASNNMVVWQAKFHTLRLENNGLRRRLRKQSAPAPAPEPQWHNPEDYPLTAEEKADGWRFLTAGEVTIPADAMFKYNHTAGMNKWHGDDDTRCDEITYFTRTPLPK